MWESSQVGVMRGSSQVGVMWGSSQVGVMRGSSQVKLYGESYVSAYSAKLIECHGYNIIRINGEKHKKDVNVVLNESSHLIVIPDFEPNFEEYSKRFPIKTTGKKAILYKAVHKKDGIYFSDYNNNFTYEIGKIKKEQCNPSQEISCSNGIHLSDLSWAISYGYNWDDLAILECESDIKDIVIAKDCDGKCRTSKCKILREINKNEYGRLTKQFI
jgi:hypothetical protein